MNIEEAEEYFEKKYKERFTIITAKQKNSKDIVHLEDKLVKKNIERDTFTITSPSRNLTLFNNKCKYCKCGCVKDNDRFHYLKYGTCTNCYILHEER